MIDSLDRGRCTGCGRCVQVCPTDVFRLDPALGKSVPRYAGDCQTCYTCELECPSGAIRIDPFRKPRVQAWDTKEGAAPAGRKSLLKPIAFLVLVGLVLAGATGIRLRDYAIGSSLGIAPQLAVLLILAGRLRSVRSPADLLRAENVLPVLPFAALLGLLLYVKRRVLFPRTRTAPPGRRTIGGSGAPRSATRPPSRLCGKPR